MREQNQSHFGQAQGKFHSVPPVLEQVDFGASKHTTDLVLEGKYNNKVLSLMAKEFVQYMKRKASLDEIPVDLSIKEWTQKIKYGKN